MTRIKVCGNTRPEDIDLKHFRTVDDIVNFVVDLLAQKPADA